MEQRRADRHCNAQHGQAVRPSADMPLPVLRATRRIVQGLASPLPSCALPMMAGSDNGSPFRCRRASSSSSSASVPQRSGQTPPHCDVLAAKAGTGLGLTGPSPVSSVRLQAIGAAGSTRNASRPPLQRPAIVYRRSDISWRCRRRRRRCRPWPSYRDGWRHSVQGCCRSGRRHATRHLRRQAAHHEVERCCCPLLHSGLTSVHLAQRLRRRLAGAASAGCRGWYREPARLPYPVRS